MFSWKSFIIRILPLSVRFFFMVELQKLSNTPQKWSFLRAIKHKNMTTGISSWKSFIIRTVCQVLSSKLTEEESNMARQACAGLLWTKQFFYHHVKDWMHGNAISLPLSKWCNLIGWWSVKISWSWHFEVPRQYFLTLDMQQSKRHNANNGLRIVHSHSSLNVISVNFIACFWIIWIISTNLKLQRNMFWSSSSIKMRLSWTR